MQTNKNKAFLSKSAILLLVFICLIYSNTLDYPWHFDDYSNISHNPSIQISSINCNSIIKTFYGITGENIFRPLAYFTFGLNWFFNQDHTTGYRIVNISIHILAAFFLFLTIFLLFKTPNLICLSSDNIYFIALLSSVLWAIHPIQIQAVTYIVQRMASMAALFYIMGIFCYLKARIAQSRQIQILFYTFCGIAFLFAISSKSNAIVLPASLLLLEFTFFRDLTLKRDRTQALVILVTVASLIAIAGAFLFLDGIPVQIFEGFANRPFTLYQRLLTQPHIILFYLSQIFYPIPSRFSITHDCIISTSFFTPWFTLPAILLILVLIIFSILRIKKNPLISFAILFYFGNHIIESSIIPLDLIFEHRNYLPSMFLFVPISVGIKKILDYYRSIQKPMFCFFVFALCCIIISLGLSTYIRNLDWRSVKTLWGDAMKKAPHSARPAQMLAWGYYERIGEIETAIALYKKGLELKPNNKTIHSFTTNNNLANIYYSKIGDFKKALEYAKKAHETIPNFVSTNIIIYKSLVMLGRDNDALIFINKQINKNPKSLDYIYFKSLLLLKLGDSKKALKLLTNCLSVNSDSRLYLREIGICFTQIGNFERGYWFLKIAHSKNQNEKKILLWLAENRIRAGKQKEAKKWIQRLVSLTGTNNFEYYLKRTITDPFGISVNYKMIASIVAIQFLEQAQHYNEKAIKLEKDYILTQ